MISSNSDMYFLRVSANQVIGPLQLTAIESMLRSGKINDMMEVSTDQRTWVRLRLLLNSAGGGGQSAPMGYAQQPTAAEAAGFGSFDGGHEPVWDFGVVDEGSEVEVQNEVRMEDVTCLPGRPAPLPGKANTDFSMANKRYGGSDVPMPGKSYSAQNAPLPGLAGGFQEAPLPGRSSQFDAPLPGNAAAPMPGLGGAELPGRSVPLPGSSVPMPGQSAPLPGSSAPMPGQSAYMPGQSAYYPGQQQPNPYLDQNATFGAPPPTAEAARNNETLAAVPPRRGEVFADFNPYKDGKDPFAARAAASHTFTSVPSSAHSTHHAPQSGSQFGMQGSTSGLTANEKSTVETDRPLNGLEFDNAPISTGGAQGGAKPGFAGGFNQMPDAGLSGLGYNVDDLFERQEAKQSIFSLETAEQGRQHTVLGAPAVALDPSRHGGGLQGNQGSSMAGQGSQGGFGHSPSNVSSSVYGDGPYGSSQANQFGAEEASPEQDSYEQGLNYSKYLDPEQSRSSALFDSDVEEESDETDKKSKKGKLKKKSSKGEKKSSKRVVLLASVALLLVLGGVGAFAYLKFGESKPQPVAQKHEEPVLTQPLKPADEPDQIDLKSVLEGGPNAKVLAAESVAFDNFKDYQRLLETSVRGKSDPYRLFSTALMRARDPDFVVTEDIPKIAAKYASASGGIEALARGTWDASAGAADAARSYLEQVSSDSPFDSYYVTALGGVGDVVALRQYLATTQGEIDQERVDAYTQSARRTLDSAITSDSKLPFAYYWLGMLNELNGKPQQAIDEFKRALKVQPYHVASLVQIAKMYLMTGDLKNATQSVQLVLDKLSQVASPAEISLANEILGECEFVRHEYAAAIKNLKASIEANPKNASAILMLARVYNESDSFQEGLNFFTLSQFLDMKSPAVILGTAVIETGLGRFKDARKHLEDAEKTYPDDARFPMELAQMYEANRNFTSAQAEYSKALQLNPRLVAAKLGLARVAWRGAHDLQQANKYLADVHDTDDVSINETPYLLAYDIASYYIDSNQLELGEKWLRKALEIAPDFTAARLLLANMLSAESRYDEALALLDKAKNKGSNVDIRTERAKVLFDSGKYDAAQAIINKILEEDATNGAALVVLARLAIQAKDLNGAQKAIEDATKVVGDTFVEKALAKGLLSEAKGEYENAKMTYDSLIRLRPDARIANYYLAHTYEEGGNKPKALELYSKYIEAPSYRMPLTNALLERARLYLANSVYKLAEADFQAALSEGGLSKDKKSEALLGLATVAIKEKNLKSAISYLNQALETGENVGKIHFMLGGVYANLGNTEEVIKELNEAKNLGYKDPLVDRMRGYAYKERGKSAEAEQAFKDYLKTLDPKTQSAEVKEILRQIDSL